MVKENYTKENVFRFPLICIVCTVTQILPVLQPKASNKYELQKL